VRRRPQMLRTVLIVELPSRLPPIRVTQPEGVPTSSRVTWASSSSSDQAHCSAESCHGLVFDAQPLRPASQAVLAWLCKIEPVTIRTAETMKKDRQIAA